MGVCIKNEAWLGRQFNLLALCPSDDAGKMSSGDCIVVVCAKLSFSTGRCQMDAKQFSRLKDVEEHVNAKPTSCQAYS